MAICPGAGVDVKTGVGGKGVCVGVRAKGVEVVAGITINAAEAGVMDGRDAVGRHIRIMARVEHISTEAMISMASNTLRVKIFFISTWFT
jgi:hypothetical protein